MLTSLFLLVRTTRARLRCERGFSLIETLVAMLILAIAMGMAVDLYASSLESNRDIRNRAQMLDRSDFVKYWTTANLAPADIPPSGGDWKSLQVTANGRCYSLELDPATDVLSSRSATTCAGLSGAAPFLVADFVANTASSPLFRFRDRTGAEVTFGQARQVDIELTMDNAGDRTLPFKRTLSYTLGGVYLANEIADNSITTVKIVDGAVTNEKIAAGAVTGSKFADGSIGATKLTTAARTAFLRFPLVAAGTENWQATVTGSWLLSPAAAFQRAGLVLGEYCLAGRTLQARGSFLALNRTASPLLLEFKLVSENGVGGAATDFALSAGATLSASAYAEIETAWQAVDCITPSSNALIYSPLARTNDAASLNKQFTLVSSALELRYQ